MNTHKVIVMMMMVMMMRIRMRMKPLGSQHWETLKPGVFL